jgi:hypothetical protein
MNLVSNVLVLAMAVTFALLALQAEPVTQILGFTFSAFLFIAAVVGWNRADKG